jgi:ribosomal protein S18 acetylase RimI-like enzyme
MTVQINIRQATLEDATGLLGCLHDAFEPYRGAYTPDAFTDTTLTDETIRRRLREMHVLVATTERGDVVGTVGGAAQGDEGHIRGMAVRPQWAGSGVAERLLAAVETELRASGCTRVTVDTAEPLLRAMRFYERNGYRRTGRVGDFFGMKVVEYAKRL